MLFILLVSLYKVSMYNTQNSQIIIKTRQNIFLAIAGANIVINLIGYDKPIVQAVILPFYYFLHVYILYCYHSFFIKEKDTSILSLTGERESLFGFMKEISNAISEHIDLEDIFKLIVKSAVQNTNAEAAAIMMVD